VNGLLIIVLLFAAMYFLMIRPQRAKQQAQLRLLNAVEVGDEILTVGGVYGIVQEIEPDEDGGDLVVEIAEGIHVRIARKALATVVKPEDEEEDESDGEEDGGEDDGGEDAEPDGDDISDGEAEIVAAETEIVAAEAEAGPGGVVEVNDEQDSVNPGTEEGTAPPERS
jgi:preprotein translocase subunit YajC